MARVVQHHPSKPPYLLIVFVFLFVIATVLAVVATLDDDEQDKAVSDRDTQITDLNDQIGKLKEDQTKLVRSIKGSTGTPGEAIKAADAAAQVTDERGGIANELKSLAAKLKLAKKNISDLEKTVSDRDRKIQEINDALAALTAAHEKNINTLNTEIKDCKAELAQKQDEHKADLDKAKAHLAAVQSRLDKDIKAMEKQNEKSVLSLQKKTQHIQKLEKQIRDLKDILAPPQVEVVNKNDGKVFKVDSNAGICYIDLGTKDGVRPGMTFAVYGRESDNKEDTKGQIRVITAKDNLSECKIVKQKGTQPIVGNDNVANLAFSAARTFVFVVFGEFDLNNDGSPSKAGRTEIIRAIKRFGGKVADDVDFKTDYVVIGEEPRKPSEPGETASDSTMQAYKKQLARYKEYFDLKAKAETKKIPVLNQHRFLTFTGYLPEKKAR
ncbi:MAG: hypothetical protein K8S55_09300 [Phycisphaerae bacterium]|nr:hypothetical protein [Phycisphaerae bacterium]